MKGLVIKGTRNVFTVASPNGDTTECRIKGKLLKTEEDFYNPIAPGDYVEYEPEKAHNSGLIISVYERRNAFMRFNIKGRTPQLLASNVDLVVCVTSPASPPFRPRFLDRVLLQAEAAAIPAVILLNKSDLLNDDNDIIERVNDFARIGYKVLRTSVKNNEGLDNLRMEIKNKIAVFTGQSGVGKSSLINAIIPEACLKIGDINEKYDRGNHVTVLSRLIENKDGMFKIVDTPGVRNFVPHGIKAEDLEMFMPDFSPFSGKCSFGLSCGHNDESGCKIKEAADSGLIHRDRFTSFVRIREELFSK